VKADMQYLNMGAISLDDVTATFGNDAASVLERKAQNIKTAKRLADEYDVSEWRELFNPVSTTAQLNFADLLETTD